MQKAVLVATLAVLGTGMAQANLLNNGSFDAQTVSGPYVASGFEYLARPLTGWDVYSGWRGVILFDGSYQPVADGANAIQLEKPGDTVSQTFATTIGQTYQLNYALSAYDDGSGAYTGGMNVSVAGVSQFVTTHTNQFTNESLSFTANAASTTLTFLSVGTFFQNYPQLDNVSVNATTAVPEPQSLAMMLAGLAAVGLVRRRKA
jgi:hypothetical protein